MKSRKMLSVLCAMAMMVSALPAASAADAEPLSKYAGQTIAVQAVDVTEDGMTSRIVNVAIPEGATKAEEDALVYATAFGHNPFSARSVNAESIIPLSMRNNFTLTSTGQRVGGGNLPSGYSRFTEIYVDLDLQSPCSSQAGLSFQVKSYQDNWQTGWYLMNVSTLRLIFQMRGFNAYHDIEVNGRTNSGYSVAVSACHVSGLAES